MRLACLMLACAALLAAAGCYVEYAGYGEYPYYYRHSVTPGYYYETYPSYPAQADYYHYPADWYAPAYYPSWYWAYPAVALHYWYTPRRYYSRRYYGHRPYRSSGTLRRLRR